MPATASISAQSHILGELQADYGRVRGEGGVVSPTLVVPLTIALNPRAAETTVAITELWGRVRVGDGAGAHLGEMVRAFGAGQPSGLWASHPSVTNTHEVELRVSLSASGLRLLEQATPAGISLTVEFRAGAAWTREEQSSLLGPGGSSVVELRAITWVRTDEIRLDVPASHWAQQVLPHVGSDRFRLVLLTLPRTSPLTPDKPLVRWFDEARSRYDQGDYRGCVERCRDVRRAIETALEATRAEPVSAKAEDGSGITKGLSSFLDGVWSALAEVTNDAHHSEHGEPQFSSSDARVVLLTTAVMLEYLASLLAPAELA